MYTDNPIADYDSYCAEQEAQLQQLPKCYYCAEHIQDEYCFEINDVLICETCLNDNHRKAVEDYIE